PSAPPSFLGGCGTLRNPPFLPVAARLRRVTTADAASRAGSRAAAPASEARRTQAPVFESFLPFACFPSRIALLPGSWKARLPRTDEPGSCICGGPDDPARAMHRTRPRFTTASRKKLPTAWPTQEACDERDETDAAVSRMLHRDENRLEHT